MTLQQLKYILALDDHRHFGRAAQSIHISQPTLTMQVRKLEEEMGFSIFDRHSNPVSITSRGSEVIRRARRIIGEANGLQAFVQGLQESIEGRFKIGIIPTLAPSLLPRFLPAFTKAFPQTELIISEVKTVDMLQALLEERLDMGICSTPVETDGIREIPCFIEPFVAFGKEVDWPETGDLDLSNFDSDRLLLLDEGHCFRNQALQVCSEVRTPNSVPSGGRFSVTSGSLESLKGLVRAGLGFSLLPELSFDARTDGPWVRKLASPQPSREVSLVCSESFIREELLMNVQQTLKEVVTPEMRDDRSYRRIGWKHY
jgi:LysR family hydrogen peroxide-inducible transcriptional activator